MQHPSKRFLTNEIFESLHRWSGVPLELLEDENFPQYNPAQTVAAMDAASVKMGIICAWTGSNGDCLISNDEVLAVVSKYPTRFRGLACADIRNPVAAVKEIRKYVLNHGFVGVRFLPWLWEKHASHAQFYPIYAECVQLDVPFCLQVGQTGPLRGSEFGEPIPYLERVLLDFPKLKVVAGHIGSPWVDEILFLCRKFPNLYIDTSAYTPERFPPALVEFMRSKSGRKRVMYGSNYPMIQPQQITGQLGKLGLDEEALHLYLYGNAERVFKLGPEKAKL